MFSFKQTTKLKCTGCNGIKFNDVKNKNYLYFKNFTFSFLII